MDYNMPRHPISYVSKSTGLTTHAVRVWERRYSAVEPTRTETNRRLYSDADIDRLKLLKAVSDAGHSIGSIAQYSDDDLREMLRGLSSLPSPSLIKISSPAEADGLEGFSCACRSAVLEQDSEALSQHLSEAMIGLSQPVLLEGLIAPLMTWIGESWHEGSIRIAQEHLASATVKSFLFRLRHSLQVSPEAPVVAIATPAGESHEVGALLASVAACSEGWRPLYFGANLPASEMANAAAQADASAAALSIAQPGERAQMIQEVRDLRQFLPARVTLIVGGAGATVNRIHIEAPGVHCVDSLGEFQSVLRKIAQ
jgi:DNA-binding transcriptional MerR regulator/methylmalonyl-CoA mutase cobalamin-binding subunit